MALESTIDVTVGDAVTFAFTVENVGDDAEELSFRSGLRADFAVREAGEEIWRASDGKMYTQMLESATLAPGDDATYEEEWPNPEPGQFEVVATLEDPNRDVSASAEFSA